MDYESHDKEKYGVKPYFLDIAKTFGKTKRSKIKILI